VSPRVHLTPTLALALALIGCAPAPLPPMLPAPSTTASVTPPDLRWRAVRMPQLGASLEFPGVPVESSMTLPKPQEDWVARNVEITSGDATHRVAFSFSRLDAATVDRRDDEAVLDRMPSTLKSVDTRDPLFVGGFRGIAFQGHSADGAEVVQRMVIAGRSLFMLRVDAPAGAMPLADAKRFLDSFRLDLAWIVVPLPELRCTVALPDAVIALRPTATPRSATTQTRAFYLGGTGEIGYYVAATPIAAAVLREKTPDQILDETTQVIAHFDGGHLEATAAITVDGFKGHDVIATTGTPAKAVHSRVFVADQTLYQVAVSAKTTALVSDEGALRFLGSLRLNQGI
jgi:hypothetical protein